MSNEQAIMDAFVAQSLVILALKETNRDLLEALKGVVRVADRATDEFDAAHDAIAKAEGATA